MDFQVIKPPLHLADYIRHFWYLELNAATDKPFIHHSFAHHCCEVVFCYKGKFRFKAALKNEEKLCSGIYGQTQTTSEIASNTDFGVFGFYLYPYAIPQLFGVPANELTGQSVDIKTLCGKPGEELEEKIMMASGNMQRIEIVSDFFEARLKNIRAEFTAICSSIKAISSACTNITVKTLASNHFLSIRQFERRFKEFSGFSPKQFLRIARFNSLLNKPFQEKRLFDIAFDFGYYDEAHFSHDFKQFSGITPKAYFHPDTIAATDRGTVRLS